MDRYDSDFHLTADSPKARVPQMILSPNFMPRCMPALPWLPWRRSGAGAARGIRRKALPDVYRRLRTDALSLRGSASMAWKCIFLAIQSSRSIWRSESTPTTLPDVPPFLLALWKGDQLARMLNAKPTLCRHMGQTEGKFTIGLG